jgi:hydroxymethylpyrimidine/phosphomethylpyrimidine kinase
MISPPPCPSGPPPLTPAVALTIAGSDSGGGAGIQADLKTFAALGVYGASVITAVTAQNTRTVEGIHQLPGPAVQAQLSAVLSDLPVAAVKTGMLGDDEVAAVVAAAARDGLLPNLVVDPVLVSTSGSRLGVVSSVERLLPYATVLAPNLDEASTLVGRPVRTPGEMAAAAAQLGAWGARCVVVTGGDLGADAEAVDAVWTADRSWFISGPRLSTRNTHGSGCTFSAAIAARLALGDAVPDALGAAKAYVAAAIGGSAAWRLGSGHGPLDHFGWTHEEVAR